MVDFEEIFSAVNRIVIDSREDCSSALFVPIKGEKQDGHRFIPMANMEQSIFLPRKMKKS